MTIEKENDESKDTYPLPTMKVCCWAEHNFLFSEGGGI